jgi:hypothetical protein
MLQRTTRFLPLLAGRVRPQQDYPAEGRISLTDMTIPLQDKNPLQEGNMLNGPGVEFMLKKEIPGG